MADERELATRQANVPAVSHDIVSASRMDRGLSRPSLPKTRRLEQRDVIAVDIDEHMDEAAAIEAAAPAGEPLWLKLIRTLFVAATVSIAWLLLPPEATPTPPIELPDAVQGDLTVVAPEQLAAEKKAIATLAADGPHAAIDLLRACVDAGNPSHRMWRTYLVILERLDPNKGLLEQARVYAERHPDRLEAAHFLAVALARQDIDAHRDWDTWRDVVKDSFKQDLASAQSKLKQAIALLGDHKADWPDKARRAWHDTLLLDSARLFYTQWLCEEAPFEHNFCDEALNALGRLRDKTALNAIELKRDIYKKIIERWPWRRFGKAKINGKGFSRGDLQKLVADLETTSNKAPEGE